VRGLAILDFSGNILKAKASIFKRSKKDFERAIKRNRKRGKLLGGHKQNS